MKETEKRCEKGNDNHMCRERTNEIENETMQLLAEKSFMKKKMGQITEKTLNEKENKIKHLKKTLNEEEKMLFTHNHSIHTTTPQKQLTSQNKTNLGRRLSFPREAGLINGKIRGLHQPEVSRHPVTDVEVHHIARHQLPRLVLPQAAVPQTHAGGGDLFLELLQRPVRPQLLYEGNGGHNDDGQSDDHRIVELPHA